MPDSDTRRATETPLGPPPRDEVWALARQVHAKELPIDEARRQALRLDPVVGRVALHAFLLVVAAEGRRQVTPTEARVANVRAAWGAGMCTPGDLGPMVADAVRGDGSAEWTLARIGPRRFLDLAEVGR